MEVARQYRGLDPRIFPYLLVYMLICFCWRAVSRVRVLLWLSSIPNSISLVFIIILPVVSYNRCLPLLLLLLKPLSAMEQLKFTVPA